MMRRAENEKPGWPHCALMAPPISGDFSETAGVVGVVETPPGVGR